MKRKLKLLRNIRKKKKKDRSADDNEVAPIDFTGIQVNPKAVDPTLNEQQNEPEQEVDPEEARRQRKNLAIEEMFAKNAYLERMAFRNNEKEESEEDDDEGIFGCMMCGMEIACGDDDDEEESSIQQKLRSFKIRKDHPRQKIGLSFVAFKQQGGIFVCKIKEGSKFNATGLKIGMRVVSVNGTECPERVGELMKMLKKVKKELVLEVEVMNTPTEKEEEEVQVPQEEVNKSTPIVRIEVETRQQEVKTTKKEVEMSGPEVKQDSSQPRRLYSSDDCIEDSDGPQVETPKAGAANSKHSYRRQDSDSSEEESKDDKYQILTEKDTKLDISKSKFELMKKQIDLMKKKGTTMSFRPKGKDSHEVSAKDLEGEDTDETDSDTSEDKEALEEILQEDVPPAESDEMPTYQSDSSQSSGTFWTSESANSGLDKFTAMLDGLIGADQDRLEAKRGQGFTLSEAATKIQEGAPIWMFFE